MQDVVMAAMSSAFVNLLIEGAGEIMSLSMIVGEDKVTAATLQAAVNIQMLNWHQTSTMASNDHFHQTLPIISLECNRVQQLGS